MEVKYDVKIPRDNNGMYSKMFLDFYESEHQNMQIECSSAEEAKRIYHNIANYLSSKRYVDAYISKRGNTLYLIRS